MKNKSDERRGHLKIADRVVSPKTGVSMPVEPRSALRNSSVEDVRRISCANWETRYAGSLVNLRVFSSIGIIGVFGAFCAGAASLVVINQHGAGN